MDSFRFLQIQFVHQKRRHGSDRLAFRRLFALFGVVGLIFGLNGPGAAQGAEAEGDPVLRHAVFFKFKEETSDEDIQNIVNEFRELPSKIEEIIDFEWGVNNSPESHDDGFTHCFLVSFADEDGLAAYLPHPAHRAFASVLRPPLKELFVVDYWGSPKGDGPDRALKHAVFFKFKDDAPSEGVRAVEEAFAALPDKISTIRAFEWGKHTTAERHDHGFSHCFMVSFDSEKGRAVYLPHADHKAFVEVLKPVVDRVRVLDFWTQP